MALIKCTECGKAFSDKASACPNCGCPTLTILEELNNQEGETIPPEKKASSKEEKLFCSVCGNELPADSDFCQYCGNKIANTEKKSTQSAKEELEKSDQNLQESQQTETLERKPHKTKLIVIVAVIAAAIALCIALIVALKPKDTSQKSGEEELPWEKPLAMSEIVDIKSIFASPKQFHEQKIAVIATVGRVVEEDGHILVIYHPDVDESEIIRDESIHTLEGLVKDALYGDNRFFICTLEYDENGLVTPTNKKPQKGDTVRMYGTFYNFDDASYGRLEAEYVYVEE